MLDSCLDQENHLLSKPGNTRVFRAGLGHVGHRDKATWCTKTCRCKGQTWMSAAFVVVVIRQV